MGRACSKHCVKWKAYRIHVGKPERKTQVGRPGYRWKANIKINLRDSRLGGFDWIRVAQDRDQCRALVKTVTDLRIP
jgi:hypothetical protein